MLSKPIACPKPSSRLEDKIADRAVVRVTERDFKQEVRTRDRMHCRCCLRKVQVILALVPERAEVHHLHGRGGDLRYDARCALLLCASCHEKVTGRVAEKWHCLGTRFVTIRGERFIDARHIVRFERVP